MVGQTSGGSQASLWVAALGDFMMVQDLLRTAYCVPHHADFGEAQNFKPQAVGCRNLPGNCIPWLCRSHGNCSTAAAAGQPQKSHKSLLYQKKRCRHCAGLWPSPELVLELYGERIETTDLQTPLCSVEPPSRQNNADCPPSARTWLDHLGPVAARGSRQESSMRGRAMGSA